MSEQEAAKKISPETFFDEMVPKILAATQEQRAKFGGVCEIQLFGENPAGWTVDLNQGSVSKGSHGTADLYLEMDRGDFALMMIDKLDLAAAIDSGRVRLSGQPAILNNLAVIFAPRSMEY